MINDYLGQEAGDVNVLILSIMKILPDSQRQEL